jgi:pyrroloquinoline quinone biosynthesis protein B
MRFVFLFFLLSFIQCKNPTPVNVEKDQSSIELVVLGTVQDGGAPHIGCIKSCCEKLWKHPDENLKVVSLGLIDRNNDKIYIFEATPDFPEQMAAVNKLAGRAVSQMPDGIFITHAHIGHYTGLMYLGREAKGAKNVPVYTMPKFNEFLSNNGPWDQLVTLENITLIPFNGDGQIVLSSELKVVPFIVPHRDEYSETVGFLIKGPQKKILFIPDIDKWSKWDEDIIKKIEEVDFAFLDATFFDAKEINNRNIAEIPHPFVIESMDLFKNLSDSDKKKIHFIHLNHTNPLLDLKSTEYKLAQDKGFNVAKYLEVIAL